MHKKIFIIPVVLVTLLALFLIVPLALAGQEACDERVNNTLKKLLECVNVDGVREHQAAFQAIADANGGTRAAGTPGYDASVAYVKETLEAAGYEVELNGFDFTFVPPATLEQLTPTAATYETGAFTGSGFGALTGQVIPVDLALAPPQASTSGCEASDFDGLDFSGPNDIALTQRGTCFFSVKAVNAEAAGAEAVIIFNQGNTPTREGLIVGNASALPDGSPSNLTIPVVGASFASGVALSQVGSTAFINVDPPFVTTQYNVLAELPGREDGNIVMAGAHLDSVQAGPGVQDNGSGSAAILETAVQMSKVKSFNTVRFAWWGAEESGLVGSTAYVNGLTQEERDDIALYLNFDMIGSPNHVFFIYDGDDSDGVGAGPGPEGSAEIEKLFESYYEGLGLPYKGTDFSGRSDYGPFIAVGIPSGGLFTGADGVKTEEEAALWGGTAGDQYDPCYHLACDTFDNINLHALDVNADAVATSVLTYSVDQGANRSRKVNLQILAINDFHGNIATTSGAFGGVGRADFLAANMRAAEADADNSITVSAGDLIGASPLISALFHDEPTIEAMNLIGLDINGVGNHEFDEGAAELLRMQFGGSHPVDGDLDGDPFLGADFEFLAANVVDDATGETIFPAYTVKNYQGVKVAFIGMTLEGTPSIVTPSGVAGLTFMDEVETVNALVPQLQQNNIEAIVVLMHQGGFASEGGGNGDGCGTLSGPLYDIVTGLDDAVDLVIGGHNNQRFACLDVEGKAVTMAYYNGRMFTDIDVTLNRVTKDMTVLSIDNKENFQDGVTPAADLTALIDKYDVLSAPLANAVIGSITTDITRTNNAAGESALGDVIADAQLEATAPIGFGEAVIAFMNPGGIRADLIFVSSGAEADGEVTYGEAFTTQPFGNSLVTMTLTGQQIDDLLEQQFDVNRILQVSNGFTYEWSASAPTGSKIDPATIMIDSVPIDLGADYRVTVNSFLADGGDGFSVLVDGTNRLGGEVDLDALVTYFGANSPVPPGPQNRITQIP